MSTVKFRSRVQWVCACVALTAISVAGCSAAPDTGPPPPGTDGSSETSPVGGITDPEPAGSVGPTEQPDLSVLTGKIDEKIKLPTGVEVTLKSVTTTNVEVETPGDIAGPAAVVVVTVTNTSAETQNVDSAVVTLETDDGGLGIPTTAGNAAPLKGDIAPDSSAEGRYLFMLDPASDRAVTISVNYAAGEPVAQFTGRTP